MVKAIKTGNKDNGEFDTNSKFIYSIIVRVIGLLKDLLKTVGVT